MCTAGWCFWASPEKSGLGYNLLVMAERRVAYTFLFGDYDDLKRPGIITPEWDYVCFTDDPALRSDVWDVRLSPRGDEDRDLENKRYAMKHMILFHRYLKDYDLSISIGAQFQIDANLDEIIAENLRPEDDMMICSHPLRDCIYDEAEECKTSKLDDPARIDAHMQRYREAGFPAHAGLYSSGVIARRHDRVSVREMCEVWWREYRRGSRRDQLSLNYAIWRSPPIRISLVHRQRQFLDTGRFAICAHRKSVRFDGTGMRSEAV